MHKSLLIKCGKSIKPLPANVHFLFKKRTNPIKPFFEKQLEISNLLKGIDFEPLLLSLKQKIVC